MPRRPVAVLTRFAAFSALPPWMPPFAGMTEAPNALKLSARCETLHLGRFKSAAGEERHEHDVRPSSCGSVQQKWKCHAVRKSKPHVGGGRRPGGPPRRSAQSAEDRARRQGRDPDAEPGPLSRTLSCDRVGRRGGRAAQHPLERGRKRGLPRRLPAEDPRCRRRLRQASARRWPASLRRLPLVYADDARDARPKGAHDYEDLIAGAAPIPDVEAPETDLAGIFYTGGTTGRSKGVMLSHRNLLASARNALAVSTEEVHRCYLHAAPMFHLANAGAMYLAFLIGRLATRSSARSPPKAWRARSSGIASPDRPARPDHDPDVRRSAGPRPVRPHLAAGVVDLRRVADQRGRAGSRDQGAAARRVLPGLRHDRAVAGRDRARVEGPHRRGPRQGSPPLGRPADADGRGADRRSARQTPAAARSRRDRRARRHCHDGLLGAAGRDEARRSSTAGCTPATAATWTRTATSISSTASRT